METPPTTATRAVNQPTESVMVVPTMVAMVSAVP